MTVELLFWGSVTLVVYAYVGYPLALAALARLRSLPVRKGDVRPSVSFIVTVHNEETRLRGKLLNTLDLRYPGLEIVVASDCSTDATDDIARSFSERGVRLVRSPERRGKEAAQRLAVEATGGEILVFSDVATRLRPDSLDPLVRNFADPTVGCVSSVDAVVDADGRLSGEGAYVRYEMWLRRLETHIGSVAGLSGSFFAARREVCRSWAPDLPSDFAVLLNAVKLGYRGVSDPETIGYYASLSDPRREYDRKVRTITRGIRALLRNVDMLNPFRYGLFAWQLASHKLCRWLVPYALVAAAVTNGWLAGESRAYAALLAGHAGLYGLGLIGLAVRSLRDRQPMRLVWFFLLANASIVHAWGKVASGQRFETWTPSER